MLALKRIHESNDLVTEGKGDFEGGGEFRKRIGFLGCPWGDQITLYLI